MNKRLFNLIVAFILIFTSACSKEENKEVLATTEFDGMTITFFHDPDILHSNGIYFSNDKDKYSYSITAPIMKNSDQTKMLYVDFRGYEQILLNDEVIDPVEIIPVIVDDIEFNLTLYHLDPKERYYKMNKNGIEHQFMTCTASATMMSHVCTGNLDIDYDEFMALISTWERISFEETGLDHSEIKTFMMIDNKKEELNGNHYDLELKKAELENGELIVATLDSVHTYYRLTNEQKIELENMIQG